LIGTGNGSLYREQDLKNEKIKIGVVGLGYVGLPLALAFARKFSGTVGFDIDLRKIETLKAGRDPNKEGLDRDVAETSLTFTANQSDLKGCNFFVVGVPTPVDQNNTPDLRALMKACGTIGMVLKPGAIVVFESTVYPGVTEEICGPIIEQVSKLKRGQDFKLAYSPERINPGDHEHSLERVVKVVSAEDSATLDIVASVYEAVVTAGVFRAASIKVAEAAKVIENTQRDLNIALMNELAIIFDRMGIPTRAVLEAAGTKWNFNRYQPGLVGGHCIGVDPYYLTTKAQQLGYHPQVILAGRRINDGMGQFVAQRLIKLMVNSNLPVKGSSIGILGLTFKENVSDLRNSRVPDILTELKQFGVNPCVNDPLAEPAHAHEEYGIDLVALKDFPKLDGLVLAVPHQAYRSMPLSDIVSLMKPKSVLVDIKSMLNPAQLPEGIAYWSL
jgi:UDP-N-acetyl-D-glucosamine/UDP-N-acetyl-D-galactosamine dehydrogenase